MSGSISSRTSFPRRRDAYGDLLRDTRGLRREQQHAREAWFGRLPWEHKDELLFELEILLKGVACFSNPRNHPGPPRRMPIVMQDFHASMSLMRSGLGRALQLTRGLLGEVDRSFVFQRYLETMLPEDTARTRLVREAMSQNTPEESLFALRHGFTNMMEVSDGLLRLPRMPFRLFYAQCFMMQREISNNAYFNPLSALEFRPEYDRIPSRAVLELIANVPGEQVHRLAALTFLSLFRMLRYLKLCDKILAVREEPEKATGQLYLVLSVLRSDARALSSYLQRKARSLLAESFEQELFRTSAVDLDACQSVLRAEGQRLVTVRSALESISSTLRLEMRRVFEYELFAPEETVGKNVNEKSAPSLASLRAVLQRAVVFFARSLGATLDPENVFNDDVAWQLNGEQLRRDIWVFQSIFRALLLKLRHVDAFEDSWQSGESFEFLKEFLAYFYALGFPVLGVYDYERAGEFLASLENLLDMGFWQVEAIDKAIYESEELQKFLHVLFERVSARHDLALVAFDKRAAAKVLKSYLNNG